MVSLLSALVALLAVFMLMAMYVAQRFKAGRRFNQRVLAFVPCRVERVLYQTRLHLSRRRRACYVLN